MRCTVCEGKGRVTIERDGKLTTARCTNCNGYGRIEAHDEFNCHICKEHA